MRQKLVEYCEAKPVGTFLLRLLATVLSLIALIAAIIAVIQELPVGTYVDSEEAPFTSYWRIPVCSLKAHSAIRADQSGSCLHSPGTFLSFFAFVSVEDSFPSCRGRRSSKCACSCF